MTRFACSDSSLTALGWPQLLRALAARTATSMGRRLASLRPFLDGVGEIETSWARVEEARALLQDEMSLPLEGAEDAAPHLSRAAKGAVLRPEELISCTRLIRASVRVRRFVGARRDLAPLLGGMAQGLADLSTLATRLDSALDPSGQVKDEASPVLASHRRRARSLHKEMRRRIDDLLKDNDFQRYLQDRFFSVRNERYVLPIKASFRSQVPGIVHNASQTGQTLFLEPQVLVDHGNELAIAESLAAEEEQRILGELSEAVGEHADELHKALAILAELDSVQAAAKLAETLQANTPSFAEWTEGFSLADARHPLLLLETRQVVDNNVALLKPAQSLVISGPNAGGKTVTLGLVGLCHLMARAGLPIPAAPGSRVILYDGVACSIGDAQDLSKGLSTFSAHLTTLSVILGEAGRGWLVLVDEIGADTDPQEGAALARAYLEALVDKGTHVGVTTHLEEVKALGIVDPRFSNARVGFDPASMAPTFRLQLGAAGVSSALQMASRIGLPTAVVERARQHLQQGGRLTEAIGRLEQRQCQVETLQSSMEQEKRALEAERQTVRDKLAELEQTRSRLKEQALAEFEEELEQQRHRVASLIAELQAKPKMTAAQDAQKAIDREIQQVQQERARTAARAAPEAQNNPPKGPVRVGMRVQVVALGHDGEVVEVDGDSIVVAVGALRTRVAIRDVVPLAGKVKAKPKARAVDEIAAGDLPKDVTRCDVRGLRVDEMLREVERFLDQSYLDGPSQVQIVHGHGTGVLKQVVRDALERSPYVSKFRPGDSHEGGDGITMVQLRG